jgi:hypothetical protein
MHTWTRKRIFIVVAVAFVYGLWFDILDSAGYCINYGKYQPTTCEEDCIVLPVGQLFAGEASYQTWNLIGHLIPGMFLLWLTPKRFELFVAGALISSIIMDSPIWGVIRLEHDLPLWYSTMENRNEFSNTCDISIWIPFYYNPIGFYKVFDSITAAILFWSIIGRIAAAVLLIWWQAKQEKENKDFSLVKLIFRGRTH